MSRRNDRKHAFSLVFQIEFYSNFNIDECFDCYFQEDTSDDGNEDIDFKGVDLSFVKSELEGVYKNKEAIDSFIEKYSEGWNFSRLSKVDLAIIRLAVYEMMYDERIPKSVAINEAVELAKLFSTDEAPAFVNGILGKIAVVLETGN